jgi:hypothetical protein
MVVVFRTVGSLLYRKTPSNPEKRVFLPIVFYALLGQFLLVEMVHL